MIKLVIGPMSNIKRTEINPLDTKTIGQHLVEQGFGSVFGEATANDELNGKGKGAYVEVLTNKCKRSRIVFRKDMNDGDDINRLDIIPGQFKEDMSGVNQITILVVIPKTKG